MKIFLWLVVLSIFFQPIAFAQVDTSYVFNTSTPFGTLDIRIAKSSTRYYYLQENKTFSYRESTVGVKTNTFLDMTSWDSQPYMQGNLREKNGTSDSYIMNFRLLLPVNYQATYSPGYPLIIMMHGAGERGNCWDNSCYHADRTWSPTTNNPPAPTASTHQLLNNDHNLSHGGKPHLDARNLAGSKLPNDLTLAARAFPGFVLFPQNLNGWNGSTVQDAIRLVRLVAKKYNIDENRIYIHGLSDGGNAVYEALKRAPWLFAAALPMSAIADGGIINQNQQSKVSHIPLWIFQGGRDTSPSPAKTQGYIRKFKEAGTSVRYSLYETLAHGVWNKAYGESDFFKWMLNQNKTNIHVFADNPAICATNGKGVQLEIAQGFYHYQWQRNGVTISGASGAVYTATTTGTYRARFSRVKNPTENDWNPWSAGVVIGQQTPAQAQITQIGTVLLKDLNGFNDAKLKSTGTSAHYSWYRNGVSVDLPGTQDDTIRFVTIKAGDCTGACTGNGTYTLVTAGYDNCPSPASKPKYIYFNDQAPVNITAPTNFKGQVLSESSVKVTWTDASANETGFEIWNRKVTGAGTYSPWEMRMLTNANTTYYNDTRLDPSTTYHYKIRAVSNNARSTYTPSSSTQYLIVTTGTDTQPPTTPQTLTATQTGVNTVTLSWKASTDNTGIKQYQVLYAGKTVATASKKTTYTLSNLNVNTNYSFTVKAQDLDDNLSAASNAATANTYMSGLYYEHSTGSFTSIDAINWNTYEFSGKVNNFTLGPRTQEDFFNFKFQGYLFITTSGSYQFQTVSSDGSRVEVNGVVVVNNDGLHNNQTVTGLVQTLSSGPKKILVKFFEATGVQTLTVRYKGPDTGNVWKNVPDAALRSGTPPATLAAAVDDAEVVDDSSEALLFSVYPNPASSGDINIALEQFEEAPLQIKLIDFNGRMILEENFTPDQLFETLRLQPTGAINDGMYLLILKQNDKVYKKMLAIKN